MDALANLQLNIGLDQSRALALFLIFLPLFFFANWVIKRGTPLELRPIAGFATLKGLLGRAAEAGQPVHLSLGTAGIGDEFTADTTAALYVLEYLAERGAMSGIPPLVTCAHPTALPVAQDVMRRAYRNQGMAEEYNPLRARWIAPDPWLYTQPQKDSFAYAVGIMRMLIQQKLAANVLIGRFGDEFLLMGETGAQKHLTQIGGTSDARTLPFVHATMDQPLIGEEIYAGGAYLSDKPNHRGSLLAQDLMRWLIIGGVIVAVVLRAMGLI